MKTTVQACSNVISLPTFIPELSWDTATQLPLSNEIPNRREKENMHSHFTRTHYSFSLCDGFRVSKSKQAFAFGLRPAMAPNYNRIKGSHFPILASHFLCLLAPLLLFFASPLYGLILKSHFFSIISFVTSVGTST